MSVEIELYEPLCAQTGERPIWDAETDSFFWIDIFGQKIFRKRGSEPTRSWNTPTLIGSLAIIDESRAVAALHHGFHLADLESGAFQLIGDPDPGVAGNMRLNDGRVDPRGRFVCGGADYFRKDPICGLYVLDHDMSIRRIADDIVLTNAVTWSPDGSILYYADSMRHTIYRCPYDLDAGTAGPREVFATFDDGGIPDGAATDTEGHIWVAKVYSGKLLRFSPSGKIDREIDFPVIAPTSIAFGAENLDVLYVTSKSEAPDGRKLDLEKGGGGVFRVHNLGVQGLPEPRFSPSSP